MRRSRYRLRVIVGIAILALPVGLFLYFRHSAHDKGINDFFALLEQYGYTPNVGFSGVFRPGNIIQVSEQGSDGKSRNLSRPLVVAWAEECFPGRLPRNLEFTIPEVRGHSSAGLILDSNIMNRLMPSLNMQDNIVADYSLTLENTRVQTFAKSDLSTEFSEPCVAALRTAIKAGDKVEWFRVIMEAVVADALTLQLDWKDNTSVEARENATRNAGKVLAQAGGAAAGSGHASELKVGVTKNDENQTVISAKGLVVIGYRARSLEPVMAQ
jgi:hypothetical protein